MDVSPFLPQLFSVVGGFVESKERLQKNLTVNTAVVSFSHWKPQPDPGLLSHITARCHTFKRHQNQAAAVTDRCKLSISGTREEKKSC